MNQTYSPLKYCGLCALGMGLFLTAQASVVSGSPLRFSYPTRAVFNIFAILLISLGPAIWQPKRRLVSIVRFLLAALLITVILLLGFRNNQTASLLTPPLA